jgi:hypothetical protein
LTRTASFTENFCSLTSQKNLPCATPEEGGFSRGEVLANATSACLVFASAQAFDFMLLGAESKSRGNDLL